MGIRSLDLPASPRAAVYRLLESFVRADPAMQRVMRPTSFRTWSGGADDCKEFNVAMAPAMRWRPSNTAEEFGTPDTMRGWLVIDCEILIRGTDCDDAFNFWYAVERSIYPSDRQARLQNVLALQKAGARSGLALFPQPAFDPDPDGVFFACQGQIKIEIQSPINT